MTCTYKVTGEGKHQIMGLLSFTSRMSAQVYPSGQPQACPLMRPYELISINGHGSLRTRSQRTPTATREAPPAAPGHGLASCDPYQLGHGHRGRPLSVLRQAGRSSGERG